MLEPERVRVPLPALVIPRVAPEIIPLTAKLAVPTAPPLLTDQV